MNRILSLIPDALIYNSTGISSGVIGKKGVNMGDFEYALLQDFGDDVIISNLIETVQPDET